MNCKTVGFALALCVVSFAAVAQSTTPPKPVRSSARRERSIWSARRALASSGINTLPA